LKWRWEHDIPVLRGHFRFHTIYRNTELQDTFNLVFSFPRNYPNEPPLVIEADGKIDPKFHHYSNGALCLSAPAEYRMVFIKTPLLENFIRNLLNPYLAGWLWFKQFGEMPWGERSHGWIGLCEFYQELFKIGDKENVIPFLEQLARDEIYQRAACPCGSGKPYRNCHKKIVNRSFVHILHEQIVTDYQAICHGIRSFLCRGY
jgi:hypothetical protein